VLACLPFKFLFVEILRASVVDTWQIGVQVSKVRDVF